MKINYEFYNKNENIYLEEKDYPDKLNQLRTNILCWYKFSKTDKILQIGLDLNITKLFCDKVENVTVIEQDLKKVKRLNFEFKKYRNLEIIVGNLNHIQLTEQYDYVIFIDTFKNASVYLNSSNPYTEILCVLKRYINIDGKVIIAIDNKFGMRYFAGCSEESTNNPYTSLVGYFGDNTKLFGKNEIIEILKNAGFENTNFYYPLPNYLVPNIIFSDKYLPTTENLVRYLPYYNKKDIVKYSEIFALKESIDNKVFDIFANSYLIEASVSNFNSDIKFISFNNSRLENYRLMTLIDENKVYKLPLKNSSLDHYNQMINNIKNIENLKINQIEKIEDNKIISDFITADTLDIIIIKYLKQRNIELVKKIINDYINYLKVKLIKTNSIDNNIFKLMNIEFSEDISMLTFVENGYWDMSFQNVFYIENKMYVFDQEWRNDNIPLEFILYRGLKIMFIVGNIDEDIRNEIYITYNIKKYLNLFEKLEKKLQDIVNDFEIQEIFTYKSDKDVINSLNQEVILLNKRIEEILTQKKYKSILRITFKKIFKKLHK